jgi:hypothetical protein
LTKWGRVWIPLSLVSPAESGCSPDTPKNGTKCANRPLLFPNTISEILRLEAPIQGFAGGCSRNGLPIAFVGRWQGHGYHSSGFHECPLLGHSSPALPLRKKLENQTVGDTWNFPGAIRGALRIPILSFQYLRRPGCSAKLLCFHIVGGFDPHRPYQFFPCFQ